MKPQSDKHNEDDSVDAIRYAIDALMEEREKDIHRVFGISCLSLLLEATIFLAIALIIVTILYKVF